MKPRIKPIQSNFIDLYDNRQYPRTHFMSALRATWHIDWVMEIQRSNQLLMKLFSAMGFSLLGAWIAIIQSQFYYTVAPFHYDSAYYLFRAFTLYSVVNTDGRLATLLNVLQHDKDCLDLICRVLMAPRSLISAYGHMWVVLFFFVLFNLFCFSYSERRTQCLTAGFLMIGCLFIFPFFYLPYHGVADYWKESIAMWILGSAIIGWLQSDQLNHPGWSFGCSVLLGCLVMARTALAAYFVIIFLPLFLIASFQRVQQDLLRTAIYKIGLFIFPVGVVCLMVAMMQWHILYHYYVDKAYDYVSFFTVFKQLASWTFREMCFAFPLCVVIISTLGSLFFISNWKQQRRDVFTVLWMVIAFPCLIIFSHALYNGFYNIWGMLCILLFAVSIPIFFILNKIKKWHVFLLVSVVIACALTQFFMVKAKLHAMMFKSAAFRVFFDNVTTVILSSPRPQFSFLVSEDYARIYDHAAFNRGIFLKERDVKGFMSIHDSYYQLAFNRKNEPIQTLAESIMHDLEAENMLVFTYCDLAQIKKSIAFEADGEKLAIPMVSAQTRYLKKNKNWRIIKTIDSPYGCVDVYQYSKNKG